ncbi:MAG TPA: T9SS type A sorting domain-containing protein, partial [Bacteroidales bacterium]|nr:T9SS type A sorting domain-containing protein [Bacteroidales bacterium]
SVTGHNNCGDGQTISLPIMANPLPAANHSITGEQSICQGQQTVVYQIEALDNTDSYIWTLPDGATGNSNTNSISVNFGLNAVSGNISVTGHNNCGDGQTISLPITINPLPETPSITMENQTLISSSAEGNQWYNQLGIIEGATEQIFSPQEDGDYYVIVTLNGCMSNPSNMIHVSLIGIQTIAGNEIVIYPNPADTWVQIEFEKEIHAKIEIHNTLGQIVNATYVAPRQPIDVSNLAPGMYIVKISQEGRKFQSKLIIK